METINKNAIFHYSSSFRISINGQVKEFRPKTLTTLDVFIKLLYNINKFLVQLFN